MTAIALAATVTASAQQPRCLPAEWSTPVQLRAADGSPAYVEAPFAIGYRGLTALIGYPAIEWSAGHAAKDSLGQSAARLTMNGGWFGVLIGADGRTEARIPPPPFAKGSSRKPLFPRAAVTADGALHVVWLEETAAANTDSGQILWYARYVGTEWTEPVKLLTAIRVNWDATEAPPLIAAGQSLHLAVTVLRTAGGSVIYLRNDGAGWRTAETMLEGYPGYAALTLATPDTALIGFSNIDPEANGSQGSHPWVMVASNKDSVILSRPQRIRWSGMGGTSYLNLLSVGAGRTALVWLSENVKGQADSIAVALSTDHGRTWSMPQLHRLHESVGYLDAVADRYGSIHVVYSVRVADELEYLAWRDGTWTGESMLPVGTAESYAMLARLGTDTLQLTWGAAQRLEAAGEMPLTRMAVLVPRC